MLSRLEGRRANPLLNALFNGGLGGLVHDGISDSRAPKEAPSRLGNIWAPAALGSMGGAALGAAMHAPALGSVVGGMLGGGLGASSHNRKLDEAMDKLRQ
jgi:hypothetical protein